MYQEHAAKHSMNLNFETPDNDPAVTQEPTCDETEFSDVYSTFDHLIKTQKKVGKLLTVFNYRCNIFSN